MTPSRNSLVLPSRPSPLAVRSGGAVMNRRHFVQGAVAVGGAAALLPSWLVGMAGAAPLGADERILVVVLMGGGNDGIDTVGPFGSGAYNDARGSIAQSPGAAHAIGNGYYLHPNLPYLKSRWDAGQLAIVQGVGHEADDHSHFSSMARWMAGTASNGPWLNGWVGRWLDGAGLGGVGGVVIGDQGVPLHFVGATTAAAAVPTSGPLFGASTENWEVAVFDCLQGFAGGSSSRGPWGDAVGGSMDEAIDAARLIDPVFGAEVSETDIVRDMQLAARVINLDAGARVLGVSFGDFDTHDDHGGRHPVLMSELNAALASFFAELSPQFRDRVAVMTMSEFGRRVRRNGSNGLDHGTASVSLVVGNAVKGGAYGQYPSLTALDNRGDLQHTVDFRSVYATVLEDWLGADPVEVLGGQFETFDMFGTPAPPPPPGSGGGGGGGGGGGAGPAGLLRSLTPARVLDTRSGDGVRQGKVTAGEWVDLPVLGRGGVPASGVGAVVLNVAGVGASEKSFVTVWPGGSARPGTANLNLTPGIVSPNLVVCRVGAGGVVSLYNHAGTVDLVADVFGWFPTDGFGSLTPARVLDTRSGDGVRQGKVTAGEWVDLPVLGRGGVPVSGVGAVVLNVAGVGASEKSFVTVWPGGSARPGTANLNLTPGIVSPNLVVCRVGAGGVVSLYNHAGTVDLVADVLGWLPAEGFTPLTPARVLDTRSGDGVRQGKVPAGGWIDLPVMGRGGVPASGVESVVLNVAGVGASEKSFVTVWPGGSARPGTANLNLTPGMVSPNLVVCRVGAGGVVSLYNHAGAVDLVADVFGWFPA